MTETKAPELDLARDLDRVPEILPADRLATVQSSAGRGELTDAVLLRELGEAGVVLIAFGLAASTQPAVLRGAQEAFAPKIAALNEYVCANAPTILEHPRIRDAADRFIAGISLGATDSARPAALPFDEIAGVRGIAMFLSVERQLVPLVRTELVRENGSVLTSMTCRLGDVAFAARGLLGNIANALGEMEAIAEHGLLVGTEVERLREQIAHVVSNLDRVNAALKSPALNQKR